MEGISNSGCNCGSAQSLPEGLTIIPEWITSDEESEFINNVNSEEWLKSGLTRRVQHYGYVYNYKSTGLDQPTTPIPKWADPIQERMMDAEIIAKPFEQLIINEYVPGQGIGKHSDSSVFGNTIVSLSLGSPCTMVFRNKANGETIQLNLKPRTLIVMRGRARYRWTHQIPATKNDRTGTRISLTFRYLAKSDPPC